MLKTKTNILLLAILISGFSGCSEDKKIPKAKEADLCTSVKKDVSIIADFECQMDNSPMVDSDDNKTTVELLDNKKLQKEPNPDKTAPNTSSHVGKYTDDGDDDDDNLYIGKFKKAIDLSTNNILKLKYRTDVTNKDKSDVKIIAKFQDGTDSAKEIMSGKITTDNKWHEISFDFSDQAGKNHKALVLIFNAGNAGKNKAKKESVFYIDDIKLVPKN